MGYWIAYKFNNLRVWSIRCLVYELGLFSVKIMIYLVKLFNFFFFRDYLLDGKNWWFSFASKNFQNPWFNGFLYHGLLIFSIHNSDWIRYNGLIRLRTVWEFSFLGFCIGGKNSLIKNPPQFLFSSSMEEVFLKI